MAATDNDTFVSGPSLSLSWLFPVLCVTKRETFARGFFAFPGQLFMRLNTRCVSTAPRSPSLCNDESARECYGTRVQTPLDESREARCAAIPNFRGFSNDSDISDSACFTERDWLRRKSESKKKMEKIVSYSNNWLFNLVIWFMLSILLLLFVMIICFS